MVTEMRERLQGLESAPRGLALYVREGDDPEEALKRIYGFLTDLVRAREASETSGTASGVALALVNLERVLATLRGYRKRVIYERVTG